MIAIVKRAFNRCRAWLSAYLAAEDPYAGIAGTGAFIVWSNQPFYPLYVAAITGADGAWPSLLTWLSTPGFVAVPLVARRHPVAGRVLFALTGLVNSVWSLKIFGVASGVGWFFLPCLIIAVAFFRASEWRAALGLTLMTGLCALTVGRLGAPFHAYSAAQSAGLTKLNLYSVTALSLYLGLAAIRLRWPSSPDRGPA